MGSILIDLRSTRTASSLLIKDDAPDLETCWMTAFLS